MLNQKRLTQLFKTFVNTVLLPLFKTNEPIVSQWSYFSNMISQDSLDMNMLEVYIDVLVKSGPQTFITNNNAPLKPEEDKTKTNSGFHTNKVDNNSDLQYIDTGFQLNKTVGASQRGRIAAMFPVKSLSPYGAQLGANKEKLVLKPSIKGIQQPPSILSGMQQIYKTLSENQLRLQGNSLQLNNGGGAQFYRFKQEKNS